MGVTNVPETFEIIQALFQGTNRFSEIRFHEFWVLNG